MEHSAATPELERRQSRLGALAADVGPKLFVTVVAAGITALLIPWITGKWQDHKEQIELRTSIAADMSRAYTDVIVSERFVAFGLVYSAGSKSEQISSNTNAWRAAWHDWLVAAGTLGAQLTSRYGTEGIAADWKQYGTAVAAYIRLGGEIPKRDRTELIGALKQYLGPTEVEWGGLEHTSKLKSYPDFRKSYTALGDRLLGRGDELVQTELRLTPHV